MQAQRSKRSSSWVSILGRSQPNGTPPVIDKTVPYPGMRMALETDKTVATPVPAHVLEAAARAAESPAPATASKKRTVQLHKWIVTAYRTLGLAILTVVVLGLVSYLATNLFYLASSSWVTPAVISPTDERILQLNARLAEQATQRDKLVADRALIAANLADVERIIAMDEQFQESFRRAVGADAADRRAQLRKLQALASEYFDARKEIGRANRAYAGMSRQRNEAMKKAGLLDEEGYLTGNYQLSQMAHSNLELAERAVDLDTRTATLAREAQSLAATVDGARDAAVSYDALRLRQEYQRASLELDKARDTKRALAEGLAAADRSIARYDRLLKSIQEAPLLAAADGRLTVVLVPYDNLGAIKPGGPLYSCMLGFVACRKVGQVRSVLPGEMEVRHPLHGGQQLRGQAVEVQLSDAAAAGENVLFAGRKPLLF
jgi:hypothetical protein